MVVYAVVPVKPLDQAKSRLSPVLALHDRRALQLAMAEDVLAALGKATSLTGTVVVSSAPEIATYIAGIPHAQAISDEGGGLNAAIRRGIQWVAKRGASWVFVVPADIPLIKPAEVDLAVVRAVARRQAIAVPDRHGTGTNGLLLRTMDRDKVAFGPGSLAHHRRLLDATVLPLDSFAIDVDTPEDLELFACSRCFSHAHEVLTAQRFRN
jgi:2-phospho-L-lactate/phosphoenolpyruvate guanylyltransferase